MADLPVNADEYRIGIDEVELHVPTITLEHMNLDAADQMVRRRAVMLPVAPENEGRKGLRGHLAGLQKVLRVDAAPCLMLVVPAIERREKATFRFLEAEGSSIRRSSYLSR
jgi:hypothetical protein